MKCLWMKIISVKRRKRNDCESTLNQKESLTDNECKVVDK